MLFPRGRKPQLWDNRGPWGKVRAKAASVRKVTLPFNKMQFSKCRRERQVGTKSRFLNSFNLKRQCSPSHQSMRSRGLGRNGHQRLYPKHCPQPFLTHSPVLVSPAEAKAVPHSQPGGPCSHSFRSGCLQHANHFQSFYEQQTGMNSLFH